MTTRSPARTYVSYTNADRVDVIVTNPQFGASVEAPSSVFSDIPATWSYSDVQSLYDLNIIVDYADGNHGALYPRSEEFGSEGITFVTARDLADGRVEWSSCAKLNQQRANQ